MIQRTKDGNYVISENGVWMPGCYSDKKAAELAFEFTDDELQKLQDEKNKTTRIITLEDLKNLKNGNRN